MKPAGQIYFCGALSGAFVKIGFSHRPAERVASAQKWVPYPLSLLAALPGGRRQENYLHQMFAADREVAEWFRRSDRLDVIIAHAAQHGALPDEVIVPADWLWRAHDDRGAKISASLKRHWAEASPQDRARHGAVCLAARRLKSNREAA